jgi:CubicO group peptidase (beta-lactamase class C family)
MPSSTRRAGRCASSVGIAVMAGGIRRPCCVRLDVIVLQPRPPRDDRGPRRDRPGYGLAIASFGPMFGHAGSLPGYQAFMAHDPDRHLTVVVLTNLQFSPSGDETANTIARHLIGTLYSAGTGSVADADDR